MSSDIRIGLKVEDLYKTGKTRIIASHLLAIPLIKLYQPNIVHETYYSKWTCAPQNAFRVLTAYDMIHERFPRMFLSSGVSTAKKKIAFARADHIICISESTRNDLLEFFDVPSEKVTVVYLGFDAFDVKYSGDQKPHYCPYLLYVGQRSGYKNFERFIRAYTSSEWLRNNFRICCFGGGSFTLAEREMLKTNRVDESRINQISGDDSVLANCYQNAAAFVYPSLYEGFGIPPLEAMSLGCPVISSNTSSIPEVIGDAGEYFEPNNVESIKSSIEMVLQSSERQVDLIEKGFERCKLFTWEKCAIETFALYGKLTRQKK